jgi:D-alanine-D-alanine ligase
MKVVLVYDAPFSAPTPVGLPEDFGAEYEDAATIDALLASIRACGYEAEGLVLDDDFPQRIRAAAADLVFNIAEGRRGRARESLVPGWLDHLGIPYTGSDGLALAVSLDKAMTKTLAVAHGVHTLAFERIGRAEEVDGIDLNFPLFVKPNGEGSSMGVRRASLVETPEALRRQVAWVLDTYRQDCLVEEFAPGREFCVGLLGNGDPRLLPVVEVRSEDGFYPYEEKRQHRKELLCPAPVSEDVAEEMRHMALTMTRILGCRDLARVDFKLDATSWPAFLEINPLPGLSPHYGIYPRQAEAAGLTHEQLIGEIIRAALDRGREPERRSVA